MVFKEQAHKAQSMRQLNNRMDDNRKARMLGRQAWTGLEGFMFRLEQIYKINKVQFDGDDDNHMGMTIEIW